jgi:hypothetical protein
MVRAPEIQPEHNCHFTKSSCLVPQYASPKYLHSGKRYTVFSKLNQFQQGGNNSFTETAIIFTKY